MTLIGGSRRPSARCSDERDTDATWRLPASNPIKLKIRNNVLLFKSLSWLGRQDSNLGMAESKSAALPLGYAPTGGSLPPWRADHSGEAWTDQRPLTAPPACSVGGSAVELSPYAAASGHAEQIAKPGKPGFRLLAAAFLSQRLQKSFRSRLPHRHGQDLLAVFDRTAT